MSSASQGALEASLLFFSNTHPKPSPTMNEVGAGRERDLQGLCWASWCLACLSVYSYHPKTEHGMRPEHKSRPQASIWVWEILGNLPGPWFFPFGKDREITRLRGLLWGHKNGHKAFSQIQSPGLQNALELSHEKSHQRSRDFAGFPESSLRMSRIFITSPCFLQLSLVQKEEKKMPQY